MDDFVDRDNFYLSISKGEKMRAIISFTITPSSDEKLNLEKLFGDIGWKPNVNDANLATLAEGQKTDILATVAGEDKAIVAASYRVMIYSDRVRTWGLVNEPNENEFVVRLRNKFPEKLKKACESLIASLRKYQTKHPTLKMDFGETISVLEPHSEVHAFYGNVLPEKKLKLAWEQRKAQAWAGAAASLLAILSLIASFPIFWDSTPWNHWLQGNLERFSTTMVVTVVFSWLPVLQRWQELKDENVIEWDLSRN